MTQELDAPEAAITYTISQTHEMTGKQITEEMGIHKQWYIDRKSVTKETLPEFIRHLTEDYVHDYGTICHAMTAAALAAMNVVNESPQGGVTGFQAGAIMWEFIREWMHIDGPARLIELERMLYPQNFRSFRPAISQDAWKWLQEKAQEKLAEEGDEPKAHDQVLRHWQSIVDGTVPFGWSVDDEA